MDLYNIPHDDGKTYRRKAFMKLLTDPEKGYVDGATDYCMLVPYAKQQKLSTTERIWLAFLYGLSYSETTALRFFQEFPDITQVKKRTLAAFWEEQKSSLWFNPDKKYLKLNNQVVPAIGAFISATGKEPEAFIQSFTDNDALYRAIKKDWKYFGPHGAYLFFDAMYGLLPDLYMDPSVLDWKNCGKTVGEGMAHLLYQDELIPTHSFDLEQYNRVVNKIQEKTQQPKVIIESTLCAFRKFFKKTRYVGYYADRMLEECRATEEYLPDIDVWKLRKQAIPEHYLGELHGWSGIRKELCNSWIERGEP